MKIKYELRIYIYLFLLITLFSVSLIMLFTNRKKELKKEAIETELTVYVELINNYLQTTYPQDEQLTAIDSLVLFFPKEIRISIFDDDDSSIIYDNIAPDEDWKRINSNNNISVIRALLYGSGSVIRQDEYHDDKDYYFYAIHKNNYIIRIGLPYIPIDLFQKSYLILFSLSALLFLVVLGLISSLYFGTRRSLKKLKLFVSSFAKDNKSPKYESFQDDELRDIQSMIANVCKQLESKEKNAQAEREKLLEIGIAHV